MKFSEKWLREWVDPNLDSEQLVEQLTELGLEVDTVVPAAAYFSGVVVGEIIQAQQHENADRLRCCQVDVGQGEPLDIVCGGVNARAGIKVAVAMVGAVLPGDFKIKKSKLRGKPSHGMICSAGELGLGEGLSPQGGILELAEDAPVGFDFRDYYDLDDAIIDIELTPNRGDCASIVGVAREVCVKNRLQLTLPDSAKVNEQGDNTQEVELQATQGCPRYAGRVVSNINMQAKTPLWMQERLRRSGLRGINPVVDVMNYVMIEMGQPLHAFDLDKLSGPIQVRYAKSGESITLLDEKQASLDEKMLVIADDTGPKALAGIMGGLDSGVSEQTNCLFLESAFFEPNGIRRSASTLNLQSDSSYRFERGVDYNLQILALERATELLLSIVGGQAAFRVDHQDSSRLPQAVTVTLRYERIERILGVKLQKTQVVNILTSLGMTLLNESSPWLFRVPSFRFDIEQEIDLIEELARIHGYQNIPPAPLVHPVAMVARPENSISSDTIKQLLAARGYCEAITYSFVDPKMQQHFISDTQSLIDLTNPISTEYSQMRVSLWPSMIATMQYNLNRQNARVRLFEVGCVFTQERGQISQPRKLAMLAVGSQLPAHWGTKARAVDYYALKADVTALLSLTHRADEFEWRGSEHEALHPGQSASLYYAGQEVGHLGVLHPMLGEKLGLSATPILFEVDWDVIVSCSVPEYTPVPRFPAIRRDLAVVVDVNISASALMSFTRENGGEFLDNVEIFDIYQGEGIEVGQKSVALGLTFLDPSRTLIDSEVDDAVAGIVQGLHSRFNAIMRA